MSFLEIYKEPLSAELGSFLTDIKPNVERYSDAKHSAQKERMIIIGKVSEYQKQFPQRSEDHRALSQAMAEEGWSKETISMQSAAYREFNRLNTHEVVEYKKLAEAASPMHLYDIATDNGSLAYDAAMHLKRTGSMPSRKAMRGHKGGHYNSKFEPIRAAIPSQVQPEYSAVTEVKQPEPYIAPKPEPINITAQVVAEEPVSLIDEQPQAVVSSSIPIGLACRFDEFAKEARQLMSDYYSATPEERKLCSIPMGRIADLFERARY